MKRSVRLLLGLGIAAAAVAGIAVFASRSKPITVETVAADRGLVAETVTNTRAGTVKACDRARMAPPSAGKWMPTMKKPPGAKKRKKESAAPLSPQLRLPRTPNPFPVVGIGASAGGLEALEQFLKHVPADSGMAFVIVQHLDPTHKGIMVELLQRATRMPVVQVRDRQKVAPGRVYVIPPNKDLSILHGVLHLLNPAAPRGLRLPIDFFFRSLADDCQTRCI
jgi:chemotaxis response regulator CheB